MIKKHIVLSLGGIYSAYIASKLTQLYGSENVELFYGDFFSDISSEPLYMNNEQFIGNVAEYLSVKLLKLVEDTSEAVSTHTLLSDVIASKLGSIAKEIKNIEADDIEVYLPIIPLSLQNQNEICTESVEKEWADLSEVEALFHEILPEVIVNSTFINTLEKQDIKKLIEEEWQLDLPRSERKRVHIAMFSGGAGSAYVAYYMVQAYGIENCKLFFTNTLWEDEDNLRFMDEISEYIGIEITEVLDGRTPEEVFFDMKYLGNSRLAKCSEELKVRQTLVYLEELRDLEKVEPILYFGIAPHEKHRRDDSHVRRKRNIVEETSADMNIRKAAGIRSFYAHFPIEPIETRFPLIETLREDIDAKGIIQYEWGIQLPRMYTAAVEAAELEDNLLAKKLIAKGINGFSHANCGGRCVRGGFQHYATLYAIWPDQYKEQEEMEERFREHFKKDVSILKKNGGPYTLRQYRIDMEENGVEKYLFTQDETVPCVCSFS